MIITDTKFYSTITQKNYDTQKEGDAAEAEYIQKAITDFNNRSKIKWYREGLSGDSSHMTNMNLYKCVLLMAHHYQVTKMETDGGVFDWEPYFMTADQFNRFVDIHNANGSVNILNAWRIPENPSPEEVTELWSLIKAFEPTTHALLPGDWFMTHPGLMLHINRRVPGTNMSMKVSNIVMHSVDKMLRLVSEEAGELSNLGLD